MSLSWKMTPEVAGACLLAASEVPNFLAGALPSFMTIGRFAASEEDVSRLRDGEVWASVPIIAVGVGASLVFESYWPALVTAVTALYYYMGYERHIRNPSSNAQPINSEGNMNGGSYGDYG
jgi:hypothetical protein